MADDTRIMDDYIEDDDRCDLDPNKICDNCCKCLELDEREYNTILADFLYEDTLIEDVSKVHTAPHQHTHINVKTIRRQSERHIED